jgi:uncharacterized protein YcfJ
MRIRTAVLAGTMLLAGCATSGSYDRSSRNWRYYDYDRPDPSYGGYHADRYYRETPRQRERRLSERDRIYRGQDGRYYCRRSDGSTGLIVGAIAGGVLGNMIAPGGSERLGTILGAIAGGVVGREIDRGDVKCR